VFKLASHVREEHRYRIFQNRVLGRIPGLKRDEMTGGRRKLHNEELYNLYSSPDIMRMTKSSDEKDGAYITHGRGEEGLQTFSWKA
jgi:hypothetical protein